MKPFKNGVKNMSFMVKNDMCQNKHDKIKNKLNIKFLSTPVHDEQYIKAKVREFDDVIKTNFLGDKIPKENKYYTCIACITIDSVIRIGKKRFGRMQIQKKKDKDD